MNKYFYPILPTMLLLTSCANYEKNPDDPYESFNRVSYKINDGIDKAILKPLAQGYVKVTPNIAQQGVSNLISNVNQVPIFLNDLAQFKFEKAAETASRFVFNSTFGLFGLLDLTKPFGLPKEHANDVGMTLAFYGWENSEFLVVPLLGPATVRDGIGRVGDAVLIPSSYYIKDAKLRNINWGVRLIEARSRLLNVDKIAGEASFDNYIFQRESYMQYRKNQLSKAGLIEEVDSPSLSDILNESGGDK
ncbi:hypothetical protein AwWohl_01160 [Gammaproteobacteria bacterium]|nr:hypothetical protein AwWohl_01160 [Gammaproteobacteria bacterium]